MKKTALLTDDDEAIRVLVGNVLRREGFAVDFADNGQEALELIEKNDYGVVLLDLIMRQLSGHELIERLRVRRPELIENIVVITGADETDVARVTSSGVPFVLRKPIDNEALVSTVYQSIRDSEAKRV